ncbi:MAG: hypothetical protein LBL06_04200 [Treponema sp.]|nr:hypothetical protein [Treponema sp.]
MSKGRRAVSGRACYAVSGALVSVKGKEKDIDPLSLDFIKYTLLIAHCSLLITMIRRVIHK